MGKWIKKLGSGGTPLTVVAKVIDSLDVLTNNRTNAPSIRAVKEAINNNWLTVYPVGSIYMSVNNVDPAAIFGGTWVQIKDKFLLACGTTYTNGSTGGVATNPYTPQGTVGNHTLTENEIPAHVHAYERATSVGGHALTLTEMPEHSHDFTVGSSSSPSIIKPYSNKNIASGNDIGITDSWLSGTTRIAGGTAAHNHPLNKDTPNTGSKGGGAAHNHGFTGVSKTFDNMPPYLAVNVWVRTA